MDILNKIRLKNPLVNKLMWQVKQCAFEAYCVGEISLAKLAEILAISIEEARFQLMVHKIPLNLGINDELELLDDIRNA